jgi:hypothetical protein
MKRNYFFVTILSSIFATAQVGINKINPNSTLAINGSFEASYREVNTNTYAIASTDHYISYNGTANTTFTLPIIGTGTANFTGRVYRVKNLSTFTITLQASGGNVLRLNNNTSTTFPVLPGGYVEVVNNANTTGGTWDLSFLGFTSLTNNVEVYGTQLRIPPHALASAGAVADWTNHANTGYDTGTGTDAWWVISKTSTTYTQSATLSRPSRMVIVYEYQGTPFNTTNLYPFLTPGNSSSFPDIFAADFISLVNNGTAGRTRLTVSVSRLDLIGDAGGGNLSNWSGNFLLNALLTKRTN